MLLMKMTNIHIDVLILKNPDNQLKNLGMRVMLFLKFFMQPSMLDPNLWDPAPGLCCHKHACLDETSHALPLRHGGPYA
jgi:hypothetical protein